MSSTAIKLDGPAGSTPELRAVNNYMSSIVSAVQLADVPELEKAVRLLKRSLTSAKKAGLELDTPSIEARVITLQREGYSAAVERQIEKLEKRAAKGDAGEVSTCLTLIEDYSAKARELGAVIELPTDRIEQARRRAEELARANAERERIINDHLNKVGQAFLGLYSAATGKSPHEE
jgi:hypothetical protein